MSNAVIDYLIEELNTFRQTHPVAKALQEQYAAAPIELMTRTFLDVFLEPEQTEQAADTIARTAIENDIPYPLLLADINAIKQALLAHYRRQRNNPFDLFEQLDAAFETTKNAIARRYLRHTARQNDLIPLHGKASRQRLVEIYDHWFAQLRKALLDSDLNAFEQIAQNNARFMQTLEHPETLMVCSEANACKEVRDAHLNIMRQAVLLYMELTEEHYEQAYLLYAEMQAAVRQLASLLTTLYLNYETNQLTVFFNLLENIPYLRKHAYLTIINVRRLQQLNELKGEDRGDAQLQQVERALQRFVADYHANFAYVRGLQGDFYLLSLGLEGRDVMQRLNEWLQAFKPDTVSTATVNLRQLKYLDRPNLRLLVQYLHELKPEQPRLLETEDDVAPVNRWIADKLEANLNLQKLLTPGNLRIHVQPLVDTVSGKTVAFEALGRLKNGQQTLSAGLFIDRLIQLGLIERFDTLILGAICTEAPRLEQLTDTLFINCSPASLRSDDYLQRLKQAKQGPLQNIQLVVELTEQTMLEHTDFVKKLHEDAGLVFAIDDFGTGYSSLLTVVELAETGAVRYLKVDGSLTQQLAQRPAIQRLFGIVHNMASDLSLVTVAEFIEDDFTLALLRKQQINLGQGYFLGKPQDIQGWLLQKQLRQA